VWSPNLGGVFFSFPLCWSEASVLQDGVNVLYEGEDCGGKQVRDPWRHHRPRQERHHWTETRKQETTNEDRSGSITLHLRLVSDFTSPSTPSIDFELWFLLNYGVLFRLVTCPAWVGRTHILRLIGQHRDPVPVVGSQVDID
ncbi:hypothetical protein CAPTEDRAFT_215991, partial [Capitella teleta]